MITKINQNKIKNEILRKVEDMSEAISNFQKLLESIEVLTSGGSLDKSTLSILKNKIATAHQQIEQLRAVLSDSLYKCEEEVQLALKAA